MEIILKDLIPKDWVVEDVSKDKIKVYYINKGRGSSPNPRILPKVIKLDENFMECFGLFLGDGDLNRKEKGHLTYASRDKDLAKEVLDFLVKRFDLNIKNISFSVLYLKENKNIKKEWSDYLKIPKEKVKTRFSNRYRNECIHIQVNSVVFRKMFEIVVKEIMTKNFIDKLELRRSFLRGLFGAEGSINIMKKERYIGYMGYHFSFYKEKNLAAFVKRCLKKDEITSKVIERKTKGDIFVQITGWPNYWKMFNNGLISLSLRKKNVFLDHIKQMDFYCQISDVLANKILVNTNKRQIAKNINVGYLTLYYNFLNNSFNKNTLLKVAEFKKIDGVDILKNVVSLKGKNTERICDRDLANFVFNL